MTYFDTTELDHHKLYEARKITSHQDKIVHACFLASDYIIGLTASDIFKALDDTPDMMLLTSVRRSINSLYKLDRLLKLNVTRTGMHGRAEVVWRRNEPQQMSLMD